jgi:Type IV secretion-system coupling protein DNA-binding domain
MRFDPTRCAHCGGPPRTFVSEPGLTSEGRFPHFQDFFFCSDECFYSEIDKYLPKHFGSKKLVEDDPRYKQLVKDRDQYMERVWPSDRIYSNEELVQMQADLEAEQRIISNFEADWDKECTKAWKAGIDRITEIWQSHHAQMNSQKRAAKAAMEELVKPRPIPEHIRFEHTHILGPSGSGKTTLIERLVLDDMAKPDPPAMVIIDPKGLMVQRISKLAVFNEKLKDRLVYVDPTTSPVPALNMFEPPPKGTENQVISNFAYVFSQAGVPLTGRMLPPFMFAVRLMFALPGANIFTLMDLFDDHSKERKFQRHIDALPDPVARRFFDNDFYTANYADTKQLIKSRLYQIVARPELSEMFNAPMKKLNIFDCIQTGRIVLVNTGNLQLGSTTSQLLGRYIISETLTAAFRRATLPKDQWKPAYLYIDEFQDYADDDKTPELLRLAREYRVGVVLAHQNMKPLNEGIRNTISTNTSIKYSATPEGDDKGYMARDLRCDTDFLDEYTHPGVFACYARGMNLKHPFLVATEFGRIEREPQMTPEAHRAALAKSKNQLGDVPQSTKVAESIISPRSSPPPQPKPASDPHGGDHTEPAAKWGE